MEKKPIKIFPSILAADFGRLNEDLESVKSYSDGFHIDLMDGHFVPNLSFGPDVLACLKTDLELDAHLMAFNPDMYYEPFKKIGVKVIHIHPEAVIHFHRELEKIKSYGMKASAVLNPSTPISSIEEVLTCLDRVLIMSVNPGFCGQKFIEGVLPKIKRLKAMAPDLEIQVDGGINTETAKLAIDAGADILVTGSYLFSSKDRKKAIDRLRGL